MHKKDVYIDFDSISAFVEDFLPNLITFNTFSGTEKIPDRFYHDGEWFKLADLIGYPFITEYLSEHLSTFLSPISAEKKDTEATNIPFKFLNSEEITILGNIGINIKGKQYDLNSKSLNKVIAENFFHNPVNKRLKTKEIIFILNNLASLDHMIKLVIKKLEKYQLIIRKNLVPYKEYFENSGTLSKDARQEAIKSTNPSSYRLPKKEDHYFSPDIQPNLYDEVKKDLSDAYPESIAFKTEECLDLIAAYKIIELQINYVKNIIELIELHSNICEDLRLIKIRNVFGCRLSKLLKELNVKTPTVLAWLGIVDKTLSDYKTGKTLPSTNRLLLLSSNLGVSIDYLIGNSDTKSIEYEPALHIFKRFGFSPSAYSQLSSYRDHHQLEYAKIMTTLNLLLEESDTKVLVRLTQYMTNNPSSRYSVLNSNNIEILENRISYLLESDATHDSIMKAIGDFKEDISNLEEGNVDDTILFELLRSLIRFKKDDKYDINSIASDIISFRDYLIDEENNENYWDYVDNFIPEDSN